MPALTEQHVKMAMIASIIQPPERMSTLCLAASPTRCPLTSMPGSPPSPVGIGGERSRPIKARIDGHVFPEGEIGEKLLGMRPHRIDGIAA